MFVLFRLATACGVFMLVLAPFGVFETWWGPFLAFGSQLLVGMAFAGLVYGFSTRLTASRASACCSASGMLPLILFSGAFFPIANLGPVLRVDRPAHAAVARRQPAPDVLPRHGRLVDRRRSTSACSSPLSRSAGSGPSRAWTKRLAD